MKYLSAVVIAILIFAVGFYFGDLQKKCICETCSTDTVFVEGKTIIQQNPSAVKTYAAVNPKNGKKSAVKDTVHHQGEPLDTMSNPCDSIRTYEYSDSAVTIKDSIQGYLLQQTIIYKPAAYITKTIRKDSLIYKSGFYIGGSAALNSIRIEGEYLNKNGWSYGGGYDLINKSPTVRIARKIW